MNKHFNCARNDGAGRSGPGAHIAACAPGTGAPVELLTDQRARVGRKDRPQGSHGEAEGRWGKGDRGCSDVLPRDSAEDATLFASSKRADPPQER